MEIFSIFSIFCLLVIIIRFILILKSREAGEDKFWRLLGMLVGIVLLCISWAVIYAFFGYDANGNVVGEAPTEEVVKKSNNSLIKFEKENGG